MPSPEQITKMKEVWKNSPLCTGDWARINHGDDTVSMCPMAALVMAEGVTPRQVHEAIEMDENKAGGIRGFYQAFKHILQDKYGIQETDVGFFVEAIDKAEWNTKDELIEVAEDIFLTPEQFQDAEDEDLWP